MKIRTPLKNNDLKKIKAGDKIQISGIIYTARDSAHMKLVKLIKEGQNLPFTLTGQIIYYVGPAPAKPGEIIGSAGPTTSYRMDPLTIPLLKKGLSGMIGKGRRSPEIRKAMKDYKAVYFAAVGGAAALISKSIKKVSIAAYPELGPEAIRKLEVKNFPAIVVNDIYGNDLYEMRKENQYT